MCKLFIATGALSPKQTRLAIAAANKEFRVTEWNGFGFLASNGPSVARGRYLEPSKYAGYMQGLPDWLAGPQIEESRIPKGVTTLVVHGRTSTNVVGLQNVHPFAYKGCYLAHNGMVDWTGSPNTKPAPVCDSEQFLHWLLNGGTWETAATSWAGWGAIALFDPKADVLTVAKYSAQLSIARRIGGKGWVMATSEPHLLAICRLAGIALDTEPLTFPGNTIVRFKGGQPIGHERWAGFSSRVWTQADNNAMGFHRVQAGVQTANPNVKYSKKYLKRQEAKQRMLNQQVWHSADSARFPDWTPTSSANASAD